MAVFIWDVKLFGAVGDGKTNDTSAIQAAVDACTKSGGGKVYFGPGNYLTGTILLKNNVCLYIEAGAIITGSADIGDYIPSKYCFTPTNGMLFMGEEVVNVTIEGHGCINGNGQTFWESEKCNAVALRPKSQRPHALIFFVNSQLITIKDVKIINSPCYTIWILGADDVKISGVDIDNPLNGPNTDAIDIDCSSNVQISECNIKTGDDCIALKSDIKRLGIDKECKNIVVTNCILHSSTCGIRIGYEGDGVIKNCIFSDLAISASDKGIDIISILPEMNVPFTEISKGAQISDIIFSNIVMKDVNQAIYVWQGDEIGGNLQGHIERIQFNNISAISLFASLIGSFTDKLIKDISLNNVNINIRGHLSVAGAFESPGVWACPEIPWGVYLKNIDNLSLNNVQICFDGTNGPWESFVKLEKCSEVELNLRIKKRKINTEDFVIELSPVILDDCDKLVAFNSRYDGKAKSLFLLQGSRTRSIKFVCNTLFQVEKLFELTHDVNTDEVQY